MRVHHVPRGIHAVLDVADVDLDGSSAMCVGQRDRQGDEGSHFACVNPLAILRWSLLHQGRGKRGVCSRTSIAMSADNSCAEGGAKEDIEGPVADRRRGRSEASCVQEAQQQTVRHKG